MSLGIKNMNIQDHKKNLKSFLQQTNAWLISNKTQIREEVKTYKTIPKSVYLYEGILLPFSNSEEEYESNLLVRIIEDDFKIFVTRKRTPYKILIETIEFLF